MIDARRQSVFLTVVVVGVVFKVPCSVVMRVSLLGTREEAEKVLVMLIVHNNNIGVPGVWLFATGGCVHSYTPQNN